MFIILIYNFHNIIIKSLICTFTKYMIRVSNGPLKRMFPFNPNATDLEI